MPHSASLKSLTNTEFNSVPHYFSRILTTPYNTHTYSLILTTYLTHILPHRIFTPHFSYLSTQTLAGRRGGAYTTLPKCLPVVWCLVQSQLTSDHLRVGSTYREVFSVTKIRFRHQTLKPVCLIIIYVVSMSENTKILCKNYSVLCSHCIICNHYSY